MRRPDDPLPLSQQKPVNEDVRSELAAHLELRTEELIATGLSPEAARAEIFEAFWKDLTYAVRLLRGAPGFALASIFTLALGIGANTAIFSVVNGVLLRPLPYDQPDRLVDLVELHTRGYASVSWTNFLDIQAQAHSFDALAEYGSYVNTIQGADQPLRATVSPVSRDFFKVMHGGKRVMGEFGFDVIGVMPPGFDFPSGTDIWHPLELNSQPTSRTAHNWPAIGRLRASVTPEAAQREADGIFRGLKQTAGVDFDAVGARVTPLQDLLTGSVRKPLLLLLGASALLLLAACTNLASNLLARGTARATELSIRAALGAGRSRIVRQVFTESLVIAALGCGIGLAFGMGLLRILLALAPPGLDLLGDTHLDPWVLGFTALLGLVTSVLFGLFPAFRISDVDAGTAMREGARAGSGPRRQKLWSMLVTVEVALALLLLVGSGLMLRSFATVLGVNLGFTPQGVVTAEIDLPERSYPELPRAVAFHDRALEALRQIPGVTAAGVTNVLPLQGDNPSGGIQVEGRPLLPVGYPVTGYGVYRIVSPGYFAAMGMQMLKGRDIAESDVQSAAPVVVVNEALAKDGWAGEDPIGRRMRIGGMDPTPGGFEPYATVVGVVRNVPGSAITSPPRPTYYYPYRQLPWRTRHMIAVVRTALPSAAVGPQIRQALHAIDPEVPAEFQTMDERLATSIADRRFTMIVLGTFAITALLLAFVGIYGVVSYAVAQRTREIGIRIALGAQPGTVVRMVQARAMAMVGTGIILGVAGAIALTRVMRSMLFEISPTDPLTFAAVIVVLILAGFLASWFPAKRGTKVDPMVAIRSD